MTTQPAPNRRSLKRHLCQLLLHGAGPSPVVALLLSTALLFAGCDSGGNGPAPPGRANDTGTTLQMGRDNGTVTVPFKAKFFTELVSLTPDKKCGVPPNFLNKQKGFGEATHLGRFSTRVTFCINMADLLDDGQLTGSESLPFGSSEGSLIAANGDELWVLSSPGEVVPSDHPDFDFQFTIRFEVSGGTGRFEGASGSGVQHGFVNQQESRTQHRWSGELTLPRGK